MPLLVIFRSRGFAILGLAAMALSAWGLAGCRPAAEPRSVLLIVVDTLRADHVGALRRPGDAIAGTGSRTGVAATPLLDRWSEGTVRFRSAATPAPFTMPAMAAMLSGAWPDRTGVVAHEAGTTFAAWKGDTLAEAARRAGHRTAAVIANPWLARTSTGFERGFDEFVRLYQPGQAPGASGAAAVTDEAVRLLEAARDRPFFLWAHYFDPHMPYEPPADTRSAPTAPGPPASRVMRDFDSKQRDLARLYRGEGYTPEEIEEARRLYEGEVRYVDREVARLLGRLAGSGRAEETIVVFASDHGESLGEHGLFFAHDFTLYEELVRVPLLVKAPGVGAAIRDDEVSLVDVAPTVCRLASFPCEAGFDGRDLFSAGAAPRTLFAATSPRRSRGTPWERLEVAGLEGRWTMARSGRTKLLRIPRESGPAWEAYDLARDPLERSPLATRGSDAVERLAAELDAWNARMSSSRPPAPAKPDRRQQRRDDKSLRSLGYLE